VPQGNAIQHVADPLANVDGRNPISHCNHYTCYNCKRQHVCRRARL
jgi:hypothetical protein